MNYARKVSGIQSLAHRFGEGDAGIRLLKEVGGVLFEEVRAEVIHIVTAGEDDFEGGFVVEERFGEVLARETIGHDHIREQEVNGTLVLLPERECFDA